MLLGPKDRSAQQGPPLATRTLHRVRLDRRQDVEWLAGEWSATRDVRVRRIEATTILGWLLAPTPPLPLPHGFDLTELSIEGDLVEVKAVSR